MRSREAFRIPTLPSKLNGLQAFLACKPMVAGGWMEEGGRSRELSSPVTPKGAAAQRRGLLCGLPQRRHQDGFQLRHFRGYRFQLGLKLVGCGHAGMRPRQQSQKLNVPLFQ